MKYFIPILIFIFFLFPVVLLAQTDIVPKVGASPEVAMLSKFQNINVSTYTGVPDLSIPLYNIKVDGVEIPIMLRYNSSGICVAEEATWVGLGWDLSVGGNITQTPIGEPDQSDDLNSTDYNALTDKAMPGFNLYSSRAERGWVWFACTPPNSPDLLNPDNPNVFSRVNTFQLGRPDNYSYLIPGGSGRFYLDPITKLPVLYGSKKEHVFISHTTTQTNGQWIINDLKGVKYIFNLQDREWTQIFPFRISLGNIGFGSATWWLSSIILPSGKQMNYTYINDTSYTSMQSQTYTGNYLADPSGNNYATTTSGSADTHYTKRLTSIETDKEKIVFELSTTAAERADIKGSTSNSIPKRLNAIHIWDKIQNKLIKTFKFNYNYFKGKGGTVSYDSARLKLISVQEIGYTATGTEDNTKPPYQFQYNETNPLPSKQSYAVDFWGYYNGQNSNKGLLPKLSEALVLELNNANNFPYEVIQAFFDKGNANRGMDPTYATSGLISRITYPTGGSLQLNYEANDFSNYPIFSASDINNAQGANLYRSIQKVDFKTCADTLPKRSQIFYPRQDGSLTLLNLQCGFSIYSASPPDNNPTYEYEKYGGAYVKLFKIDSTGTTTSIDTWTIGGNFTDLAIGHPYLYNNSKVTYHGNSNDKYYFECFLGHDLPCKVGEPGYGSASVTCSVFDPNAKLPVYKSVGGGVRIASQETYNQDGTLALKRSYKYTNPDGSSSGKLMSPLRFYSFRSIFNKSETLPYPSEFFLGAYTFAISSDSYTPLAHDANGALVGYSRVEITDVDYHNNINGKTVYYYRNKPSTPGATEEGLPDLPYEDNGLEDSIQIWNSKNELVSKTINSYSCLESKFAYGISLVDNYIGPDQCSTNVNNWVFQGRWTLNYYPIQTRWYTNTGSTEYLYSPAKIAVKSEKQMGYNTLGLLGSVTQIQSDATSLTTNYKYVRDYLQGSNPSLDAKSTILSSMNQRDMLNIPIEITQLKNSNVIGSTLNLFKITSNNKIVPDVTYSLEIAKPLAMPSTGLSYTTLNTSLTFNMSGLYVPKVTYDEFDSVGNLVQYHKTNDENITFLWGYSKIYPVAKIENATLSDVKKVLGDPIPDLGLVGLSDTQISSLRSGLPKAIVTIYTYDPLIGISSQTDPNGFTTYYEYDNFGLFKLVRDKDGKILKHYKYHYQGQ